MVNDYTMQLCQTHNEYIGRLVGSFRVKFPGDSATLSIDQLKSVFDTQELTGLAEAAGSRAWATEDEKEAVELLLKAVRDSKPPTGAT